MSSEAPHQKIARLRAELEQVRQNMIESEAELADRQADMQAFEFEFEAHVGVLLTQLAAIEAEVNAYLERINQMRHERSFEAGYRPVEEQYRRTWQQKPGKKVRPPPKQPPPATQAQIKKLYRQLARKYHPDLAHNDADRAYRTQKMTAVNDAYKARSMVELMALAEELGKDIGVTAVSSPETEQTDSQMIQALEEELARCQRRLREIDNELNNFHNNSMVELALEVKFARREGRDVLAEMAAEVERQIARKTVERDMLKSQFTDLNRHRR